MLFKNLNTNALNMINHQQGSDKSQNISTKDKWERDILQEKLSNLEKKLLETQDERNILKEKFEKQQSCSIIRCKYYDYLLYEQILQKQITHQKNLILFGQQQEQKRSILDLDFYPIMFSSNQQSIGDQKYNNIISILSLQSEFCVQEIRLFFYQILSSIRRHLKQFKREASTQTEIIVTVQKNENQLNSKYLSKNPNKLEYFRQVSPYHSDNSQNLFLVYYFMGQKHTYEIKDLEMSVEEFLEDIFQQKAQLYEIFLIKNINLQQTKIDISEHMFLIELQQMQNAHNIYVLPKTYQKSKVIDSQQQITKKKDQQIQSTDFDEIDDQQFHQFQEKEQKISKQVDFTNLIDEFEETKEQYQFENQEQMEIIYEINHKNEKQELASQIQTQKLNEEKSKSESIKQQIEDVNLSQQNKQDQIFDLSNQNEEKIQEKGHTQITQNNTEISNVVEQQQSKSTESTDHQKKDSSLQQDLISSPTQQNQEITNQRTIDQQSKKSESIISLFQTHTDKNANESQPDNEKLQSITSFEVLQSEQKSENKQDEQIAKDQNDETNKEKQQ